MIFGSSSRDTIKRRIMKRLAIAVSVAAALMLSSASAFAQGKYGDNPDCLKYISYYEEYYKQKNYDEALPNWRKVLQVCPPAARQTIYTNGAFLVRRLISKNFRDPVYKEALIDTLMTLHDLRIQNFPSYAVSAYNTKGSDMFNYIKDDSKRLYEGYNEIIAFNKDKTKSTIFLYDLKAAIDLYQSGALGAEEVINTYQTNMGYLEQMSPASNAAEEQNAKVKTDLETLFIGSKVASCEDLIRLFTPRYEATPDDLALVTNIVRMLGTAEDCTDNDLYLSAVTSMYKLDPSYKSAYALFKLHSARGNNDEAIKYMEEAIASEQSDTAQDAQYSYELATFCFKNGISSKAYASARRALDLDPEFAGKANFLIAQIWGNTNCGGDEIQRRASYWVAVDYLQKAKAADETLAEEASRLIASYSKYFPDTGDAFMYGFVNGQSYSVNCNGLSAVTTVRTR